MFRALIVVLVVAAGVGARATESTRIAFGSCLRQWAPQPVWQAVQAAGPDAFVFLGDNVYTDNGPYRDRPEPARIGEAYAALERNEGFRALRDRVPVHATWDDHDYGRNDAGAGYPWKQASEAFFLDFFGIPENAPERTRPGVYGLRYLETGAGRVQLILLDTRYFRSSLKVGEPDERCPRRNLLPDPDPAATLLGEAQWAWLEQAFRQPATLRIVASSIQVIPTQHCWEKWANFPRERQRLFDLIRDTGAGGVVFISGDRHLGEISRLPADTVDYPLYEVTASGLNSAGAGKGEANRYRAHPKNLRDDHFGMLVLEAAAEGPTLTLELRDVGGAVRRSVSLPLAQLTPRPGEFGNSGTDSKIHANVHRQPDCSGC